MLKILRNKKTARKVWITLAIIIIPAFTLWGFGSAFKKREGASFKSKVFGKNIPYAEYKDALDAVRVQAIMQFGDKLPEVEKYMDFEGQAWDRILLLHEAARRKIKISDNELVSTIESYPFFQKNGQFDNKLYNEIVHYVLRTLPRTFEEQTRGGLAISKLYQQVTDNTKVNDEEVLAAYRKANEKVALYYIASLPSEFTKDMTPSENEIKNYFTQNPTQFKEPLSFNLEYIAIDSQEKLDKLTKHLNKTTDLNKLAKNSGLTVKETGLFPQEGPIPGIGWSGELLRLISKLKIGEVTSPIQMDKYFYVLKLKERKEAYIPEFDKIKNKVKDRVIKELSEKQAKEKIDACMNNLKESFKNNPKSVNFEKAAKEFKLKADATGLFQFGSYIEGIGASDIFWNEAQNLKDKDNEFSGIINTPSGYYIVKIKAKEPIDEKKFAGEKEEFSKKFTLEKRQESFSKFLEDLKKKAQ